MNGSIYRVNITSIGGKIVSAMLQVCAGFESAWEDVRELEIDEKGTVILFREDMKDENATQAK